MDRGSQVPDGGAGHLLPFAEDADFERHVLYLGGLPAAESLLHLLTATPGTALEDGDEPLIRHEGLPMRFRIVRRPPEVMACLSSGYYNLFVLDLRVSYGDAHELEARIRAAFSLLDAMGEIAPEDRFGHHRILALVSGPESERIDRLIATLGARGVGRVLREPWPHGSAPRFGERILGEMREMMLGRPVGKRALCIASGGITG